MSKVQVELMPFELQVVSIDPSKISTWTHSMLFSVLDNSSCSSSDSFFSFTRTQNEISLIMEKSEFQKRYQTKHDDSNGLLGLSASPDTWRAILVYPGELGADLQHTIHVISKQFARSNISIFQVSTFSADYTLFKAQDLLNVLNCLSSQFTILNPGDWTIDTSHIEHSSPTLPTIEKNFAFFGSTQLPISKDISSPVMISSLPRETFPQLLKSILTLMLSVDEQVEMFSMTLIDGSPSFILTLETMRHLPIQHFNADARQSWNCLEIGGGSGDSSGLGFDESGIIAYFSGILADFGINCFYLSTFRCDYVLVPSDKLEASFEIMSTHKFPNSTIKISP